MCPLESLTRWSHLVGAVLCLTLHSLSHPGIRATQCLLTAQYVWPGINTDVQRWTRSCLQCQRSKVQCHTITPFSTFTTPDVRFAKIYIEIVGPLPASKGHTYLLTCIDRFTHWPDKQALNPTHPHPPRTKRPTPVPHPKYSPESHSL